MTHRVIVIWQKLHAILSESTAAVIFASSLFSYLAMINMSDLFSCRETLFVRAYLLYFNLLVSTRSVWETICDARASKVWLGKYFAQNSLSAPTQVFQECWFGPSPPPLPPIWKFRQILALWIWVGLEYPRPPPPENENLGGGVWRLIAVSLKDTVSFF